MLDLEVRSAEEPRTFFDVTVRYSVPGGAADLAAAAAHDGAVNRQAEADKRARYPRGRTPWRTVPLAVETCGRHGLAALRHLRRLARQQAASSPEGDVETTGALVRRWGCRLSVALQRSNVARLRNALGAVGQAGALASALPGEEV